MIKMASPAKGLAIFINTVFVIFLFAYCFLQMFRIPGTLYGDL